MPDGISAPAHAAPAHTRVPRLSLNSDGRHHPLLNAVTGFVLIAGIAAFILGLYRSNHLIASCLGIAAFGVGLVGQMYSATREERIFLVTGIVAGFIGMGLGIAHGGFG
jgi:hypothetical protein